jgi:hypothetical protein
MKRRTVALFRSPWPKEGLKRPARNKLLEQYRYAVWYKANPRSAVYMRALQQERFPDAEWVDTSEDSDWINRLSRADTVVLFYPDSIGLGFGPVERSVLAHKLDWTAVVVLNGRRREFRLNDATRLGLRLRRLLEWTMLPELLFLAVFVVVTPLLWAIDAVRGRT